MHITLAEAASLLGVTKETLRNWDRSGKLTSVRDPKNNYRLYLLSDVQALALPEVREPRAEYESAEEGSAAASAAKSGEDSQERDLKRALSKTHKVLRDTDGSSSIVERFDETTKLIYLKLRCERSASHKRAFEQTQGESVFAHATRLRELFASETAEHGELFPERFASLKLSDAALSAAASVLAQVELSSSKQDVKGFAYEEMIRNTFDKGDHQQFFTPQTIVEFLVAMMGKMIKGNVCDPASGTGGFLVEVAKRGVATEKLIGLEIDDRLAWVAGINLFVHGASKFETRCLVNGGSLGSGGAKLFQGMDAIITNPPFGSDFSDRSELERYVLGRGRTSRRRGVLFIERCLDMLKEGGVLGIVIDEGVLSLPSNADVRELILAKSDLLAVISLPETTFMPYASVSTSILLLRKNTKSSPARQLTFYARAENVGRKANGDQDIEYDDQGMPRLINDLPSILSAWELFERNGTLEKQTDDVYLANPLALIRSDSNGDNRLDFKFHHPARLAAQVGLKDCSFDLVSLGEICSLRNESYVPSVDFPDQFIPYTGLAHIEPRIGHAQQVTVSGSSLKSAVKKYYRGDILFAKMRPNLRKVAIVDFEKPGYASAECVVLKVKQANGEPIIDPFLLSILLRSDYTFGQIIHLIAGIGRPRIALKDLLTVKVPLPPAHQQRAFRETFIKTRETYESLRLEAKRLSETASSMELQAIESVAHAFVGKY